MSTFGNTNIEITGLAPWVSAERVPASLFTAPVDVGEIDSITVYIDTSNNNFNYKAFICDSSKNIVSNGVTEATAIQNDGYSWSTLIFTGTKPILTPGSDYFLCIVAESSGSLRYNPTGGTGHYDTTNSYTTPQNINGSDNTWLISIYATYTPTIISQSNNIQANIIRIGETQDNNVTANLQSKTTIISPTSGSVPTPAYLVWTIPNRNDSKSMIFWIEVDDTSDTFGSLEHSLISSQDSGFEYDSTGSGNWVTIPLAGVDPDLYGGNQARVQVTLIPGTKWWRVRAGVTS